MLLYRVENQELKHGLWRDFEGNFNPIFDKLSDGLVRNMPMEDNELYRADNKKWFSSAPSKETLKHWFSLQDVLETQNMGYKVYEFNVSNFKIVSDFEVIFCREDIISQKEINPTDIWKDYITETNIDVKEQTENCIKWIKKYFEENGKNSKAIVGISGGKDSSVAAASCVKALGKENVYGVLMPQGEQFDIQYSYDLCKFLDIEYTVINIEETINSLKKSFEPLKFNNQATINTPARIRMTTLYAVAAIIGGRVCNTSNLSEDWIGYCTLWGDSVGSFCPLGNLTSEEVIAIGEELNLPKHLIEKIPIDGLQDKTDEESFGFSYEILNKYIRTGICEDINIKNKIDTMHKNSRFKFLPMPTFILK